jgi:hypothetical protein
MAKSVIARKTGDSMQAYFFWLQACQLLLPNQHAVSVGYEIETHDGFDDVVIYYDQGILINGCTIKAEYYQIKYHAGHKSALTAAALADPSFIGTEQHSILSRLKAIYEKDPTEFPTARYHFVTTWGPDYSDVVKELLREDGTLDFSKLAAAGPKSKIGIVRNGWLSHLNTDIQTLSILLGSLNISAGKYTFEYLKLQLQAALTAAGLMPISQNERAAKYEELIDRLHGEGRTVFNKQELVDICIVDGLTTDSFTRNLTANDYQYLHNHSKRQVETWLKKNYFALKYNQNQYVRRGIENDIASWLALPTAESSPAFLILAAAGSGKTNTLASIAGTYSSSVATFLFGAPLLHIDERGLWAALKDGIDPEFLGSNDRSAIREYFKKTIAAAGRGMVVVIDAINEYANPVTLKKELEIFTEECAELGIKVVLSCRDYYWNLFEATWWTNVLTDKNQKARLNRSILGNYASHEASEAFSVYFKAYDVSATPKGNAVEQFRHPLLLRFFCETYSGKKLGELSDVRLKNLFDTYWDTKLRSIAERIINQGVIDRAEDIATNLSDGLKELGLRMLEQNSRGLAESEAKSILKSDNSPTLLTSPYGRIIDEHIVIEELEVYGYERKKLIAFVFEEFMEYTMARGLLAKWQAFDLTEICRQVETLTQKYQAFNQIFGVLLYSSIMLKEQRNLSLWPALISIGSRWQTVVIETFKRLPEDQIDDTVFSAIIDLLQAKDENIQIQALELLKFGRLKRVPTTELTTAVGKLVTHQKLKIARRAVIALASFPPDLGVGFVALAIAKLRTRVDDEATVAQNSVKTLAILNTPESRGLMCKIYGVFWRVYNYEEIVGLLDNDVRLLLPLLHDNDVMVRVGATKLLGHSVLTDALSVLEDRLSRGDYNKKTYKMSELPPWAKPLADYSDPRIGIKEDYEKRAIEDAIKKVKENFALASVEKAWRDNIATLPRNTTFSALPHDLATIERIYYHTNLLQFIIKSGLELRSGKKWQLKRGFGSYILITAPRNRFVNGKMSAEDAAELARLLDMPKTDTAGYEFGIGHNHHDYWKEYIYRAWGLPPLVYGKTDRYYD